MFRSILIPLFLGSVASLLSNNVAAGEVPKPVQRLDALSLSVERDYPGVRHISVGELKNEFPQALLVDVRKREEYETSHLPGAIHAPEPADIDALREAHPDKAMVLYCTVGVRSAIAAEAFLERNPAAEQSPVVNLSGSIFAWANGGEPLVDAQGPTTKVHPYSFWWGWRYLDSGRLERAKAPRIPE